MSQGDTVFVDHSNVEVSHQDEDSLALVCSPHRHVVELGAMAQGEAARLVNVVPADPGVGQQRLSVDLNGGLVEGAPGLHGRAAPGGVGALFVVDEDEPVDLVLELGQGSDRGFLPTATS